MNSGKNKKFTISGIGEVLWDIFPDKKRVGGAPANFTFHLNNLGGKGILVSRIGVDSYGRKLLKEIKKMGISTEYIQKDDKHPTGKVKIEIDESGNPEYHCSRDAAWDFIEFRPELKKLASKSDAVLFGTLAQRSKVTRNTIYKFLHASRNDCLKVLDVNIREKYFDRNIMEKSLEICNTLKLSQGELNAIVNLLDIKGNEIEKINTIIKKYSIWMIALTRGKKGSKLYTAKEISTHPGFKVKVEDTVGAGDAFVAALTVGILRNYSLDKINELANKTAAFVCSRSGATPELPSDVVL